VNQINLSLLHKQIVSGILLCKTKLTVITCNLFRNPPFVGSWVTEEPASSLPKDAQPLSHPVHPKPNSAQKGTCSQYYPVLVLIFSGQKNQQNKLLANMVTEILSPLGCDFNFQWSIGAFKLWSDDLSLNPG
jgi:hypothetical protein